MPVCALREVRGKIIHRETLKLDDLVYQAGAAEEHFISYITPEDGLAGFVRLSLPGTQSPQTGIAELAGAALIREVHMYGQSLPVGAEKKGAAQHAGLGTRLLEEAELDASVGRILDPLKKAGVDRETIAVFLSDIGPWLNFGNHAGTAGPLREGKGTEWEGGVLVPCVVRWPGRVKPGSVCRDMAASMDFLPTVAAAAGARLPARTIDGLDLLPLLLGEASASPRQERYYYYGTELHAVRRGRWKLHVPHGYPSYEGIEPGKDGFPGPTVRRETGYALYDLEGDAGG